ncbi:MAG: hypothetical protein WD049_04675 [Candidatus Paceibacterota bacterium]
MTTTSDHNTTALSIRITVEERRMLERFHDLPVSVPDDEQSGGADAYVKAHKILLIAPTQGGILKISANVVKRIKCGGKVTTLVVRERLEPRYFHPIEPPTTA